jgi:hypothetical protein
MKRFSLRIDEALLARLAALADQEHRSTNEQIVVLLEQALKVMEQAKKELRDV